MSVALTSPLPRPWPELAREYRDRVKDKGYQAFPMGAEAAEYLRWKRGRLRPDSYRDYEACLDKLARHFADLEISDFEPPAGVNLLEAFMDFQWGERAPRTYNKNLSVIGDFFRWAVLKGKLHGDPTLPMERAKARDVAREVFSESAEDAIIAEQPWIRDRICVRLLLIYALRKGALRAVRFKHFDHSRRRLTIFTKGGQVRTIPITDPQLWLDLERHILDWQALPDEFLLCRQRTVPHKRNGRTELDVTYYRDQPMGEHGAHDWWYRCLARAGVVSEGTTSGERMHKARHTAAQRLLDDSHGNLKAAQKLLGHASIETTGDIYVDWDIDQLEQTLREAGR